MNPVSRYTVGQVFVPGGRPTITYNARSELALEQRVLTYLDDRHSILSVSGPTKTGKTVLLRSVVTDGIWLSGGAISTEDEFWQTIADELQLYTDYTRESSSEDGQGDEISGGANAAVLRGDYKRTSSSTTGHVETVARARSVKSTVRQGLNNTHTLVIDDFHYITLAVQTQIVRGLKDLIFDGLAVIVAAVPHRAYDVVRVEKEMTGRVEQLPVGFWSSVELQEIARKGFEALNVVDASGSLTARLIQESFESPHLMQDFLRELCRSNGVAETSNTTLELAAPLDWAEFFKSRASTTSRSAFDLLAKGPRQRSDRKPRVLRSGASTDIYGAILAAIASTGPLTEITYEQVRAALRDVLASEVPQRHEVTRVMQEMAAIARDQIEGEPVVDYDSALATLYISDPFFAYYLRWGASDRLPQPV